MLQEVIYEEMAERGSSPRQSMSSSLQSFCLSFRGQPDFTPAVSPACSVQTLNNVGHKSFREFLFMTLPLIVHPVIILRLLAHKMFGNMIRRKNIRSADAKLKPPREDISNAEVKCPPRSISETTKLFDTGNSLQPVPNHNASKSVSDSQSRFTASAVSNSKSTGSNSANEQMGTNMALRAIGESLVTPLEMNIHPRSYTVSEHKPVCATQSDSVPGSKPKLFRWQSKKQLTKSQHSISAGSLVNEDTSTMELDGATTGSSHDIDILAFQRELINLPTFVMDTPLDVSPVFSRSSSVPENLAGRLNPTIGSLGQLSAHNSRKRLSKSGCGSDQAMSSLVHSGSAVAITMTDPNHNDSVFFLPSEESTTDTPEDSMANIIVHFDPPQSPLLSSASGSGSPHAFEFPGPGQSFGNNLLQPGAATNNLLTTPGGTKSQSEDVKLHNLASNVPDTAVEVHDSKASSSRPEALRISPIASPINEVPVAHQAVLRVIETWISVCRADLEGTQLVVHEMRDFLKKLSVLGPEYKIWCQKILSELQLEVGLFLV